ncbi:putative ribonuclease H-like domain-containing protein [Tanacetum coccineum]
MIAIRMKKFYKKTGRRVRVDGKTPVGFDKKKLECFNCHNTSHFARECTAKGTHDGKKRSSSFIYTKKPWKAKRIKMGLLTIMMVLSMGRTYCKMKRQIHALMAINSIVSQAVKKLEAQLVTFQKHQLSLNEKLTFQANEIYEKDEKLKKYRRIGMKAVKEKEQLQKTLDSWKDSSKNLWRLINSGMSSNSKVGLGEDLLNFSEHYLDQEYEISKEYLHNSSTYQDIKQFTSPKNLREIRDLLLRPQQVIIGGTLNQTPIVIDHPLKNMVDRGIFDSGCSWHMTGNKDQLEDFEEINGGSVTLEVAKLHIIQAELTPHAGTSEVTNSAVKEIALKHLRDISETTLPVLLQLILDKYVAEILKKFDLVNVKTTITPVETKVALTKDEEAVDVDVHLYRSMIGSLMPPKTSHLNAVKRIFKYLKGKPNLGLWYPRESPFDLEAFSNSNYGGSNLDRKSTTGGCQFLGQRLISWQCKKQTIVATFTTEVEYVAAANCRGQVLWVQNQLLDYGFNFMNTKIHIDNESTICNVKNPVYQSKTKHIEIRHHFIRDCYEKKLISVKKIHTYLNVADLLTKPFDRPRFNYLMVSIGFAEIVDFLRGSNLRYALTTNPTIFDSLVKQFWQTATAKTLADGTLELHATIDTIVYTITEASIRNKLQLANISGITMLPNNEIFEGMGHMGSRNPDVAQSQPSSILQFHPSTSLPPEQSPTTYKLLYPASYTYT